MASCADLTSDLASRSGDESEVTEVSVSVSVGSAVSASIGFAPGVPIGSSAWRCQGHVSLTILRGVRDNSEYKTT